MNSKSKANSPPMSPPDSGGNSAVGLDEHDQHLLDSFRKDAGIEEEWIRGWHGADPKQAEKDGEMLANKGQAQVID